MIFATTRRKYNYRLRWPLNYCGWAILGDFTTSGGNFYKYGNTGQTSRNFCANSSPFFPFSRTSSISWTGPASGMSSSCRPFQFGLRDRQAWFPYLKGEVASMGFPFQYFRRGFLCAKCSVQKFIWHSSRPNKDFASKSLLVIVEPGVESFASLHNRSVGSSSKAGVTS